MIALHAGSEQIVENSVGVRLIEDDLREHVETVHVRSETPHSLLKPSTWRHRSVRICVIVFPQIYYVDFWGKISHAEFVNDLCMRLNELQRSKAWGGEGIVWLKCDRDVCEIRPVGLAVIPLTQFEALISEVSEEVAIDREALFIKWFCRQLQLRLLCMQG
jgi:hypothetical protein